MLFMEAPSVEVRGLCVSPRLLSPVFVALASLPLFAFPFLAITDVWSWPASDNFSQVCRQLDSSCLASDWFTEVGSDNNPRAGIVSIFVLLGQLGLTLEASAILIQAFVASLTSWALALHFVKFVRVQLDERSSNPIFGLFVGGLIAVVSSSSLAAFFALGWWFPWSLGATASAVAAALVFLSFIVPSKHWSVETIKMLIIFISSVIHPVSALSSTVFMLLTSRLQNWKVWGASLAPILFGWLYLLVSTHDTPRISAARFFEIYVTSAHPYHYLPSQFTNFSIFSSVQIVLLMIFGWLIIILISSRRDPAIRNRAIGFLAVLILGFGGQWALVEALRIREFAIVSPIRFSEWTVSGFAFLSLAFVTRRLLSSQPKLLEAQFTRVHISFFIAFTFVASWCVSGSKMQLDWTGPNSDFEVASEWMIANSKEDDVFWVSGGLPRATFSIELKRAIFFGSGFPFSEQHFEEWERRSQIVDGKRAPRQPFSAEPMDFSTTHVVDLLAPVEVAALLNRNAVEWLVVPSMSGLSGAWERCEPDFRDHFVSVYSVAVIKRC